MHTPGPWSAVCEDTINGMPAKFRVDAGGGCVALINTIGPADARLIAAAPALLAAAIDALETFERRFPDSPTAHDLRAAISAATED